MAENDNTENENLETPEWFEVPAKELVQSRLVEKVWDHFIETLTEVTVYEGSLRDLLDEDTLELGADRVVELTLARFGYKFVGWCGVQVLMSDFDYAMASPGQDGKCKRLKDHEGNHDVRDEMKGF